MDRSEYQARRASLALRFFMVWSSEVLSQKWSRLAKFKPIASVHYSNISMLARELVLHIRPWAILEGIYLHYLNYNDDDPTVRLPKTVVSSPRGRARPLADASIIRYSQDRKQERRNHRKSVKNRALQHAQQQKWQYWLMLQHRRRQKRWDRILWTLIILFALSAPFLLIQARENSTAIRQYVAMRVQNIAGKFTHHR